MSGAGVLRGLKVAPQERHGAAERFQIVAPPAGSATVDEQAGMPVPQLVPERQVALDVADLGNSLPVHRIAFSPDPERIEIEILTVQVNALLGEELIDVVGEPLAGLGVAEVQQPVAALAQEPFGMLFKQPRALVDPLRLEPEYGLHVLGVGVVGDLADALGEPLWIGLPGAGFPPIAAGVPSGIHPPVVELRAALQVGVDIGDFAGRRLVYSHASGRERRGQLPAGPRQIVRDHPPPPDVLRTDAVAAIELEHDQRAADLLSGEKLEVRQSWPAETLSPSAASRTKRADHWPGHPTTAIRPPPSYWTLKYG